MPNNSTELNEFMTFGLASKGEHIVSGIVQFTFIVLTGSSTQVPASVQLPAGFLPGQSTPGQSYVRTLD